jgi:hypothetical protein
LRAVKRARAHRAKSSEGDLMPPKFKFKHISDKDRAARKRELIVKKNYDRLKSSMPQPSVPDWTDAEVDVYQPDVNPAGRLKVLRGGGSVNDVGADADAATSAAENDVDTWPRDSMRKKRKTHSSAPVATETRAEHMSNAPVEDDVARVDVQASSSSATTITPETAEFEAFKRRRLAEMSDELSKVQVNKRDRFLDARKQFAAKKMAQIDRQCVVCCVL